MKYLIVISSCICILYTLYAFYVYYPNLVNLEKKHVVCLGLSRTGTSSLSKYTSQYMKSWHFFNGNPSIIHALGYSMVADLPHYRRKFSVDDLRPNTKYILTVRDPQKWYNSMKKWLMDIWGLDLDNKKKKHWINWNFSGDIFKHPPIYKLSYICHNILKEYPEINQDKLKDVMICHTNHIKNVFRDANREKDLLIIDVTSDKFVARKINNFLGLGKNTLPFPRTTYYDIYREQIFSSFKR